MLIGQCAATTENVVDLVTFVQRRGFVTGGDGWDVGVDGDGGACGCGWVILCWLGVKSPIWDVEFYSFFLGNLWFEVVVFGVKF